MLYSHFPILSFGCKKSGMQSRGKSGAVWSLCKQTAMYDTELAKSKKPVQDLELDHKLFELQNRFQFSPTALTGRGWVLHVVTPTQGEHRSGLCATWRHNTLGNETRNKWSLTYIAGSEWSSKCIIQTGNLIFPLPGIPLCLFHKERRNANSLPIKSTLF